MAREEVKAILAAAMDEFPGSGFIIIKTESLPNESGTDIDYISNLRTQDVKQVIKVVGIMAGSKEN